jgi:pimeloyl-ACP methyl ester carboxylesterase
MNTRSFGLAISMGVALTLITTAADAEAQRDVDVGWYTTADGRHILVSPAPGEGYRQLDFANAAFSGLDLGEEGGFVWVSAAAGGPALQSPAGERWVPRPDAPYGVTEIAFETFDGEMLEGVLLNPARPSGRGAVLLHGSGSSDRDNVWAYTFAHALAEHGVAVLFADKRGSGASTGDWRSVGFDALALDAGSAARTLAREARVPLGSIGWVGLSQGGWVAPLAARMAGDGAFVISVSSAAVPVFDQIAFEVENTLRNEGFSDEAVGEALGLQEALRRHALGHISWSTYEETRSRTLTGPGAPFAEAMPEDRGDWRWSWWARVGDYDPIGSWARTGLPTLVVYGGEDESDNVPVETSVHHLGELRSRPHVGGQLTVEVFPGLGHTLVDPETGWVSRAVLDRIVTFALTAAPAEGGAD